MAKKIKNTRHTYDRVSIGHRWKKCVEQLKEHNDLLKNLVHINKERIQNPSRVANNHNFHINDTVYTRYGHNVGKIFKIIAIHDETKMIALNENPPYNTSKSPGIQLHYRPSSQLMLIDNDINKAVKFKMVFDHQTNTNKRVSFNDRHIIPFNQNIPPPPSIPLVKFSEDTKESNSITQDTKWLSGLKSITSKFLRTLPRLKK